MNHFRGPTLHGQVVVPSGGPDVLRGTTPTLADMNAVGRTGKSGTKFVRKSLVSICYVLFYKLIHLYENLQNFILIFVVLFLHCTGSRRLFYLYRTLFYK